jgi:hypothetical protein
MTISTLGLIVTLYFLEDAICEIIVIPALAQVDRLKLDATTISINDIQLNDAQHNGLDCDTHHNDIELNNTQHN